MLDLNKNLYMLDGTVIAQIAKLLQIAILTGTDITDHMRQISLEPVPDRPGFLTLSEAYNEKAAKEVESMFDHLETLMGAKSNGQA